MQDYLYLSRFTNLIRSNTCEIFRTLLSKGILARGSTHVK